MWEVIRANKRKSVMLFVSMGICLVLLGYIIGAAFMPSGGGMTGIIIALSIWLILALISYSSGDSILLSLSNAKEITHDVHPQLFNVVEEMRIAAGLPAMPKIYIIPDPAPNAFATGIRPEKSAVAVTAGLLSRLNRDEVQGVIAHELSHINNRDVLFMTFAGVMLGSIVLVSEVFLRSLWFAPGASRRYRSNSQSSNGQGQIIIMVVAIVLAILAPIIAQLLYFAMSRKREYLADASAVRLTRYPEGLASALENISHTDIKLSSANSVTAPMYIINPMKLKGGSLSDLTSTHPPISERIKILRSMEQGAGFLRYQDAFVKVSGNKQGVLPPSALSEKDEVPIQKPSVTEKKRKSAREEARDAGDLIRAVNNYFFLGCACGLKIKIPPDFKDDKLICPRCGREHHIPVNELKEKVRVLTAAGVLGKNGKAPGKVNIPGMGTHEQQKK